MQAHNRLGIKKKGDPERNRWCLEGREGRMGNEGKKIHSFSH